MLKTVSQTTAQGFNYQSSQTFTPGLTLGGANVGMTYGTHTGSWSQLGDRVSFQARISLTAIGSSTGNMLIVGLPVSSNNITHCPVAVAVSSMGATVNSVAGYILAGSTTIEIDRISGGVATSLANTDLANNSTVMVSGVYGI